jgi:hypothetical protein
LVFSPDEWESTLSKVENALEQVRTALPAARNIHVPNNEPMIIGLHLQGPYAEQLLMEGTGDQGTSIVSGTGDTALDGLNQQLGVAAMTVFWSKYYQLVVAEPCLNPLVNFRSAVKAYGNLSTVSEAELVFPVHLGDGPALDMRERDGSWYVVVREASGDCPSGCIGETLSFFRVRGSTLERIAETEALADPLFTALVARVRHRNGPWPPLTTPVPEASITVAPTTAAAIPAQLPVAGGPASSNDSAVGVWALGLALLIASLLGFAVARAGRSPD